VVAGPVTILAWSFVCGAYAAYASSGAEAVICVSNKKLTWKVVHGIERLGVPALGPIWDS
jgi:hypothetical protein